jgi:putative flippase GtrA
VTNASAKRQFLSFALIGVVGLCADMAALHIAVSSLGLGLYGGRVFSYLVAASVTWLLNRRFTFGHVGWSGALRQWATFLVANLAGACANYLVYALILAARPLLLHLSGEEDAGAAPWLVFLPYLGVACGSVSGLAFNFILSRRLVFAHPGALLAKD